MKKPGLLLIFYILLHASCNSSLVGAVPDTGLAVLGVSPGHLEPDYDKNITDYKLFLPNDIAALNLTLSSLDPRVSISVGGITVASGQMAAVPISEGKNDILIAVSADGASATSYRIEVTRSPAASISWTIVEPQDIPLVLKGQGETLSKSQTAIVTTTFAGALSYQWILDGSYVGKDPSYTLDPAGMAYGGPYELSLCVRTGASIYFGSVIFTVIK